MRTRTRRLLPVVIFAVAGAWGCEAPAASGDAPPRAPEVASVRPSASPHPDRFGVGRAATSADFTALDIDVMPDGTGLPPGEGTAAEGADLYAMTCMVCHGAQLEGTPLGDKLVPPADGSAFPDGDLPVATRAIGNYWPYATTIFDYVRRAMPFDRPGSLSDNEVYALTAFLLWKNGIIEPETVMNAQTLPAIEMPARDRFVEDDRLTSQRVR